MVRNGPPRRSSAEAAVDRHVGARIAARRIQLGLSQTDLARGLGLTYQQQQKYEKGASRISASRLWSIAQQLRSPVAHFFEGLPSQTTSGRLQRGTSRRMEKDAPVRREDLQLMRSYSRITDPALRRRLRRLAALFANGN